MKLLFVKMRQMRSMRSFYSLCWVCDLFYRVETASHWTVVNSGWIFAKVCALHRPRTPQFLIIYLLALIMLIITNWDDGSLSLWSVFFPTNWFYGHNENTQLAQRHLGNRVIQRRYKTYLLKLLLRQKYLFLNKNMIKYIINNIL